MIVSINQPAYIPWLGYFDRIYKSDIHIVLDHVQFEKNSVTNRNKIRNKKDWFWLTVPVLTKGAFGDLSIHSIEINNNVKWTKKHLQSIKQSYSKAPYYEEYIRYFEDIYSKEWTQLSTLLKECTALLLKLLDIKTKILFSSDLDTHGSKSELIHNLCKEVGAKQYISGPFGREYLVTDSFDKDSIEILYHDYVHPCYSQGLKGFIPYMSVVDLLFHHGDQSLGILTGKQEAGGNR